MKTRRVKHWQFPSKTTDAVYTVILWDNGSLSCDCKGWTYKKPDCDVRYCKHTFQVMQQLRLEQVPVQPATEERVNQIKEAKKEEERTFNFAEM